MTAKAGALALLAPACAVIAVLIKRGSPGPVFYRQQRVGLRGRIFEFFKFRSMAVGNDAGEHQEYVCELIQSGVGDDELSCTDEWGRPVFKLAEDERVTRIGRFLRKYLLDELPQFWNVLKADHAHVALEDVPELRQLVERVLAQEAADGGDALVLGELEHGAPPLVGAAQLVVAGAALDELAHVVLVGARVVAGGHGAELEELEAATAEANALLAVEHGAGRAALDEDGDDGEGRRQKDQSAGRRDEVEGALGGRGAVAGGRTPVSYTHLTLPTNREV